MVCLSRSLCVSITGVKRDSAPYVVSLLHSFQVQEREKLLGDLRETKENLEKKHKKAESEVCSSRLIVAFVLP